MDVYRASLLANTPKTIYTATTSAIALKIWCDKFNAILQVTIGSAQPQFLACDSWFDTRVLYVMPGSQVIVQSTVATDIRYHFQEIEINEIVVP